MLEPGLCSVTFRALAPADVLSVAAGAGLRTVEWGGDVHVPPGDRVRAKEVATRTADAGMRTVSYGSYVFLGSGDDHADVIATAVALEAPMIRVWAGRLGSTAAGAGDRRRVVEAGRRMADDAAEHDVALALEFHGGTLTDTAASTVALLDAIDRPNVFTHWQPPVGMDDDGALATLEAVLDRLAHVHVFSWTASGERLALDGRASLWRRVIDVVEDRSMLMEFVAGDDVDAFRRDASTLCEWTGP